MSKKVLVVGGVAGGASAAARIRRLDEFADITVFERGPHVSFSNCCLPYYLDRTIDESEKLVLMNPLKFKQHYNIDIRVNNTIVDIKRNEKVVVVEKEDGTTYEESYDYLVLSPGGKAIRPASIKGINNENVFTVRNVVDIKKLDDYVVEHNCENIAVIGGGFIGCEVVESFVNAKKHVTLVEMQDQIMPPYDLDMVQIFHKELLDHNVDLVLKDGLKEVKENEIVLASGKTVKADVVVCAIGVTPETDLAKKAGLEIGVTGGIKVDRNYKTNDDSIYAVGDAIEVYNALTHKPMRLALAYPAQMEARAAADAICGIESENRGFIGSSVVRIFDMIGASTGLNEKTLKDLGYNYDYAYVIPMDKVGLMPNSKPIYTKVIYEVPTGKLLGAQCIAHNNASRRIDIIATLISMGGTLQDLKNLELCYAPVVGTAKDAVNMSGLVGLNLLNGKFKQVHVNEVRGLVENNACIIDVREPNEFEQGHLINSKNIPLSQIRERYNEIPHDVPVYLHCRSAQRSYNAVCALQQLGFNNVYNIAGSYLGICMHEYANDVLTGREKIVTEYNFN